MGAAHAMLLSMHAEPAILIKTGHTPTNYCWFGCSKDNSGACLLSYIYHARARGSVVAGALLRTRAPPLRPIQ
jgi:hypothetical protein